MIISKPIAILLSVTALSASQAYNNVFVGDFAFYSSYKNLEFEDSFTLDEAIDVIKTLDINKNPNNRFSFQILNLPYNKLLINEKISGHDAVSELQEIKNKFYSKWFNYKTLTTNMGYYQDLNNFEPILNGAKDLQTKAQTATKIYDISTGDIRKFAHHSMLHCHTRIYKDIIDDYSPDKMPELKNDYDEGYHESLKVTSECFMDNLNKYLKDNDVMTFDELDELINYKKKTAEDYEILELHYDKQTNDFN